MLRYMSRMRCPLMVDLVCEIVQPPLEYEVVVIEYEKLLLLLFLFDGWRRRRLRGGSEELNSMGLRVRRRTPELSSRGAEKGDGLRARRMRTAGGGGDRGAGRRGWRVRTGSF